MDGKNWNDRIQDLCQLIMDTPLGALAFMVSAKGET